MDKDEGRTLPSPSSVRSVVINEGEVAAAAGNATTTTTTTREEVPAMKVHHATAEQIRAVFSNGLITHTIMPYLSFGDLKAARQVSRTFLEMVEAFKSFKEAQVLCITDQKYTARQVDLVLNCGRNWRGIKIDDYALRRQSWNIPRHILENVHYLSIVSSEEGPPWEEVPPPVHSILQVLKSTPNVSHLQLDVCLFPRDFLDLIDCSDVRENLKDLKRLDIVCSGDHTSEDRLLDLRTLPYECKYSFAKNFRLFAKARILQRLETFRTPVLKFGYDLHRTRFQKAVLDLLQQNRETLKEVSIHLDVWGTDEEINDIRAVTLPNLRILTATLTVHEQNTLIDFLAKHPSLEELDVSVKDKFFRSVFVAIKGRSANLRKLHLSLKQFGDPWGYRNRGEDRTMDWTFLGDMTQLKDFKLHRSFCEETNWEIFGNGTHLLESLPRNQLERLSFRGIGAGTRDCGFWKRKELYVPKPGEKRRRQPEFVDVEPELLIKLELLEGFRQLKRLSFRRCPDVVDDDIMEFICKELTSLEDFEVSHCSDFTDAGIVGKLEDGSDSIRNLKALKLLRIRSCPMVTPKGLLSCLRLPLLRSLDYLAPTSVSKSFVLGIMSQNPSLESLAVNFGCLRREVLKKRTRITGRRLKTLIHLKGTDEDSDMDADEQKESSIEVWDISDDDDDMSGSDSVHHFSVRIRGPR